jgi:hypothetical protein
MGRRFSVLTFFRKEKGDSHHKGGANEGEEEGIEPSGVLICEQKKREGAEECRFNTGKCDEIFFHSVN